MKLPLPIAALAVLLAGSMACADKQGSADTAGASDWISMFDGQTLNGWKATERPENWTVEDGAIVGRGERSHLFYMEEECQNCEFKATVKLNQGGNSGMYFRAKFMEGWPDGYEAQVNNSHKDPKRTGSLYNIVSVHDQLVPDDTWWTQHIIARGNHIVIKVNDVTVVDYHDTEKRHMKGLLALQQHDPGSVVMYKDLYMRHIR
jgi:hypothetical protein